MKKSIFDEGRFFLICVIPLSVMIMLLTGPHSWPDGTVHYWTVYHFSNQVLGIDGEEEWMARREDNEFFRRVTDEKGIVATSEMFEDFHLMCRDEDMETMLTRPDYMTYYSILNYFPQVIGLSLGRALGFSSIVSFLLARLFILTVYVFFCYRAIKRTPIGKSVFMTLSLMPFTLLVASSFCYDVMVFVVSLNFVSCILSLRYRYSKTVLIESFILVFLLGAIKGGGYLVLLPLVFMLCSVDNTVLTRKKKIMVIGAMIAIGVASVVLFDIVLTGGQHLFQLGDGNSEEVYHASYAFTHFVPYLWMVINTYFFNVIDSLMIFGGTETGFMNILLMVLGVMYVSQEKGESELKLADKAAMLIVTSIVFIFTPIMLLGFVSKSETVISGLRARYYLPAMPLLIILLSRFRFWEKMSGDIDINRLKTAFFVIIAGVNVVGVIRII